MSPAVTLTPQDETFLEAVALGCFPVRRDGFAALWRCGCTSGAHGHSDTAVLTSVSLRVFRKAEA